ncbi:MAG: magnesium chelatase domain-containing protein [Bryobacteraceae bacterium]
MTDTTVKESRERIKSALANSGFGIPSKIVTINLAPANVRKEGAGFDLPIAVGGCRVREGYYYLDDEFRFPFQGRCIAATVVSPLRKGRPWKSCI